MQGKHRTVFISGNFNIVHPGHLRLFRYARSLADRLIIGVHSDRLAAGKAHLPEALRLEVVRSNNLVSEALIVDEPISAVLDRVRPDIVVKGKEHESSYNVEEETIKKLGGQLIFSSGEVAFSSSQLLSTSLLMGAGGVSRIPSDFSERHECTPRDLIRIINCFSGVRVRVIGDLIVDKYVSCEPLGMSQEDPTIVLRPLDTTQYLGGAGIVAAHAAGLGASVDLITMVGNDVTADFASNKLDEFSVASHLIRDESRPTTLKTRFRVNEKTVFRISELYQSSASKLTQKSLFKAVTEGIEERDLLVFADFNYGCLPQELLDKINASTYPHNIVKVADSQCSSQIGDVGRFKGMDLLTPTERETRLSLRNNEDGLAYIAQNLLKKSAASGLLQKLGADGLIMLSTDEDGRIAVDNLPALNPAPVDVAGAGDSLLIAAGLTLAVGGTVAQAAAIGSLAAAVQVSRVGNVPISHHELLEALR